MGDAVIGHGMFELRENEEIWGVNRRFVLSPTHYYLT